MVGNQRGGAKNLALHLLKQENEHVEVHELRGFASHNLTAALNEAYAISRATRCRQYLFSLSLNPPPHEHVPITAFEDAIERIEARLGLSGQPRGDRRGFVALDFQGEVYAIAKWAGIKTKQVHARLGDEQILPSVAEVQNRIAHEMLSVMRRLGDTLDAQSQERLAQLQQQR
ncbi:MAG: hypothetical protein ACREX4_22460 [Gammaproteobacteria bacterium]